ncbi:MAG: DUF444 family protein [Chloroflexota bacterium]|nr:DUF444 family protein [Chloroflexota bacterium]MDE2960894.1 DUF444 family protein [Chloroflexota bacterium]
MSIRDTIGVYDQMEFADNPEARCSIVLILDVSGSMAGAKIDTVNRALVKFRDIIREDSVTALRADVAVIAFDHEARVVRDFTNGTDFEAPALEVSGGTNYSNAVNLALDLIEARKQSYREGGIAYYRSLAYFLTDGIPADSPADLEGTARRLAQVEENRGVAFFSFIISDDSGIPEWQVDGDKVEAFFKLIGVSYEELTAAGALGDGSEGGTGLNLARVAELAGTNVPELVERCVNAGVMRTGVGELSRLAPRPPLELTNMAQLDGSIQWLSRSVAAVSQSQPGDSIRLPQPDYLNF